MAQSEQSRRFLLIKSYRTTRDTALVLTCNYFEMLKIETLSAAGNKDSLIENCGSEFKLTLMWVELKN